MLPCYGSHNNVEHTDSRGETLVKALYRNVDLVVITPVAGINLAEEASSGSI